MALNGFGLRCVVAFWAATFFLTGCAGIKDGSLVKTDEKSSAAATALHASLSGANHSLVSLKGMGTISMTEGNRKQKFRSVWAAKAPDRLRIELLGLTGQPVASIACDGKYYYFLSHAEGKLVKRRASQSGFNKIINIPIGAEDVFALFSGRPAPSGGRLITRIERDAPHETVLVLRDVDMDIQDRVYADRRDGAITRIERGRDGSGQLIWRAALDNRITEQGYNLPKRLTLSSGEDVQVRIDTERFWANPELSADLFVIGPP